MGGGPAAQAPRMIGPAAGRSRTAPPAGRPVTESDPPMHSDPPARRPRLLLYGMYDPSKQASAPVVRIARLAAALGQTCDLQVITGDRVGRARGAARWLLRRAWRDVDAVYVEAASSAPMPQDLLLMTLVRLSGRPLGIYFRDAYQLFRDLYPAPGGRGFLNDLLWRLTLPLVRHLATHRFTPSAGLARALGMTDAVLLAPGTDPDLPDLGAGAGHRVAYVGAFGAADGLPLLIEAMATVRATVPDAELLLVGPAPPAGLAGEAPPWVEFRRAGRAELPALLAGARLCVIPRPITAYADLAVPIKLMDYLSYGKPIVATAARETRSILEPAGAGLLAADSPTALAEAIVRVLLDADLAADLAAAARRLAVAPGSTWQARAATIVATLLPDRPRP